MLKCFLFMLTVFEGW